MLDKIIKSKLTKKQIAWLEDKMARDMLDKIIKFKLTKNQVAQLEDKMARDALFIDYGLIGTSEKLRGLEISINLKFENIDERVKKLEDNIPRIIYEQLEEYWKDVYNRGQPYDR
jgi:hypothetical protein